MRTMISSWALAALVLTGCAGDSSLAGDELGGSGFTVQCIGATGQQCIANADLWSCEEFIDLTNFDRSCTRTPDGSEQWDCIERADGHAVCTKPDIGVDLSGPGWTCEVDEFKGTICVTVRPVRAGGPALLPPGTGIWTCAVEEFGIVCRLGEDDGAEQPPNGEVPGDGHPLDVPKPGEFRSQTPGGWGAPGRGNNPGAYRDAHFDEAFAQGLTIGCEDGHTATFTSAKAIELFLPSGGKPGVLDGDSVDPTQRTSAGVFAGHLVALTLAVGFDAHDEHFGSSALALEHLVALDGACEGMTVGQILNAANDVIGGCESHAADKIKDCVAPINENFVDGDRAGGYLGYP